MPFGKTSGSHGESGSKAPGKRGMGNGESEDEDGGKTGSVFFVFLPLDESGAAYRPTVTRLKSSRRFRGKCGNDARKAEENKMPSPRIIISLHLC